MTLETPTPPPLPPEPPPSQPPIPPAPPPSDFPTSSDQTEANYRTTALVAWGGLGAFLVLGLILMAVSWRGVSLPGLPDTPDFRLPEFSMPRIQMPELDLPSGDGNVRPQGRPPEDMYEVTDPETPDPAGFVEKPVGARSAEPGPNHRPEGKSA